MHISSVCGAAAQRYARLVQKIDVSTSPASGDCVRPPKHTKNLLQLSMYAGGPRTCDPR